MIGLDTNVVVRYLVQDEPTQTALANRLVDQLTDDQPGFVALISLAEIHWVLRRRYRLGVDAIRDIITGLAQTTQIVLEQPDLVGQALASTARGMDFADVLIAASNRQSGCRTTMTFDRRAARNDGFELLS